MLLVQRNAPGEPLWGDYGYGYGGSLADTLASYEAAGALRDWQSLYQQNPRSREGAIFKLETMPVVPLPPASWSQVVRAWDLTATRATGMAGRDWTVLVQIDDDRMTVADVVRLRGGPDEVKRAIVETARCDGPDVTVALPQDPSQAGKSQVAYLIRQLSNADLRHGHDA